MLNSTPKNRKTFALLLTVFFLGIGLLGLLNHEMWRDELHFWMLVRNSSSLGDFYQNLRYESGHLVTWYFFVYLISRLMHNPFAMQGFHLAVAAVSVYLLVRYSPFSRLQSALIIFGYFFIFEYSLISRNYIIGVLFIFAFCILFPLRRWSYIPLAITLFLLSNTIFYTTMIAIALGSMLIFEVLSDRQTIQSITARKWDIAISLVIWITGIGLCLWQLIPPGDTSVPVSQTFTQLDLSHLLATLATIWKSYVPMPGLAYHFWNTNIIDDGYAGVLAIGLLGFSIALFIRKPVVLFLYLFGTIEILLFIYIKHSGGLRHWGYLFILLLACLWLSSYFPNADPSQNRDVHIPPLVSIVGRFFIRYCHHFLMIILWLNVVAGLFAYGMDSLNPFSEAKAAAQFIRDQHLENRLIVGDRDWSTLAVSGYLDQAFYYPASGQFRKFVVWNNRKQDLNQVDLLAAVKQLQSNEKKEVILVLNYPLNAAQLAADNPPSELATFTRSMVKDENYYLYHLK